jgi:hypothetical protein
LPAEIIRDPYWIGRDARRGYQCNYWKEIAIDARRFFDKEYRHQRAISKPTVTFTRNVSSPGAIATGRLVNAGDSRDYSGIPEMTYRTVTGWLGWEPHSYSARADPTARLG